MSTASLTALLRTYHTPGTVGLMIKYRARMRSPCKASKQSEDFETA